LEPNGAMNERPPSILSLTVPKVRSLKLYRHLEDFDAPLIDD
jgi:hypothetical protein